MSARHSVKEFSKKLLALSIEDGEVSEERVAAVLEALRKDPPRQYTTLLKSYSRLVKREVRKYTATVEYAGELSKQVQSEIQTKLAEVYSRKIHLTLKECPDLIAGFRIKIADDVYENSIISRLRPLEQIKI